MSGEELRAAAIQGKHDRIHTILKDRANTCSADQYGLTPLMYACWNGHVECVKFLVSNPMGVDADGKKRSCVNMVSCKGYTALHLTALDCPEKNVKEIATVLLMMGCDPTIKCRDGLTAHDIALKLSNSAVLRAYKEWNEQDHNMDVRMLLDDTRRQLKAKYTFNINLRMTVDPIDVNFNMPGFIYEPQRQGYIPEGEVEICMCCQSLGVLLIVCCAYWSLLFCFAATSTKHVYCHSMHCAHMFYKYCRIKNI